MALPYPSKVFTPFDQLPASDLNEMVANDEALAAGTGLNDGVVTPAKRSGGFKIGVIAGSTLGSTGNKSITGVGFTPKMVKFAVLFSSSATTDNTSFGAMTTTDQYLAMGSSAGAGGAWRLSSTTAALGWISASNVPSLLASYVSMDADGFTINVTTASSTFSVAYEAYA